MAIALVGLYQYTMVDSLISRRPLAVTPELVPHHVTSPTRFFLLLLVHEEYIQIGHTNLTDIRVIKCSCCEGAGGGGGGGKRGA